MRVGERLPFLFAALGLLWAGLSVLDPFRPAGSYLGVALVGLGLLLQRLKGLPTRGLVVATVLAAAYGISAHVLIEFRADSPSYYAYLRSLSFDRNLDFEDDWDMFGIPYLPPPSNGQHPNVFSVGPAMVWSPFYALAHVYVKLDRAFGSGLHLADGFSLPYRRATALGTVTVVVLGSWLLVLMMQASVGTPVAVLAVSGAVLTSPVLYYTFDVPAMSHGVTFGAAALFLFAWERARLRPSLRSWTLLGAAFGLVTVCRWQGFVYVLLLAPLAIQELRLRRVRPVWLASGAAASFLVFSPQIVIWSILFGRAVLLPQGRSFLDLSSPNWLNTLISANHGFFNWTPVMLLGLVGLVLGWRRSPMLHVGGLLVFTATAFVNGSVPAHDWAGGDAFGARRYSLVVPLMAIGLGWTIEATAGLVRRRPLLVPAMALLVMTAWNLGFISRFRARKYSEMAPIDRLAEDQARLFRESMEDAFGLVGGASGRALAYKMLSAEYFYTSFNRSGTILLRSADDRYLLRGWGSGSRRTAPRTFRNALYPEACVRLPLEEPFPLRIAITARRPNGLDQQAMTVTINDQPLTTAQLPAEWRELHVEVPREQLVPGVNRLCLAFSNALPETNGTRLAAQVERIQLP